MSAPSGAPHSSAELIQKLAQSFYEVVPEQYKTYCAFTSEVIEKVLGHFGLRCERLPCQIWYTQPDHIYVVGFLGSNTPGKWDGHVVCSANNILIDAATHHFEREFGLPVPWVVVAPKFTFPTPTLAHASMKSPDAIWWQAPPANADTTLPVQPQDLVNQYSQALIQRLAR
jgi:hypothetical protein